MAMGAARSARNLAAALLAAALVSFAPASSALASPGALKETPSLAEQVAAGKLPPVGERVPKEPLVLDLAALGRQPGKPGGELRTLISRARDVRLMVVYGYARLVGYNEQLELMPDILKSWEEQDGRVFTLHLREGHRWSDGEPFTAEDFRYWWEDIANNRELSPAGPPQDVLVDGVRPNFEVLSPTAVRYSWPRPNPDFIPRLAGASPLFIYAPAHYMKQFHARYADPKKLEAAIKEARVRNWAALHNRVDALYKFDNPDQPTLQPWKNLTRPPETRFIGERNAFFHRVDAQGWQLPYIDRMVMVEADTKLVPAKSGAGEIDLQARGLAFNNYTFLRENEERSDFRTLLWNTAKGSHVALYPNLNVNDPVWRALLRDVRFRRALSLGIDRKIINRSLYFGLALEANNTVLPDSPLYREEYRTRWATYDPEQAERLLDELGLKRPRHEHFRRLPDGRPLEIIVETAGEDTEQTDILELVRETWAEIGVKLFIKPTQRDVFRNRIYAGETVMSVWSGLENGVPTADMSPNELAPTVQTQLMWPKWGQFVETGGKAGELVDIPEARRLQQLLGAWLDSPERAQRLAVWHEMLKLHAEQVFSIGIVSAVKQPVVVSNALRNVPEKGIFNWDPGANFGMYRPDTFWFDR